MIYNAREIVEATAKHRRRKTGLAYDDAWIESTAHHIENCDGDREVIDVAFAAFRAYEAAHFFSTGSRTRGDLSKPIGLETLIP